MKRRALVAFLFFVAAYVAQGSKLVAHYTFDDPANVTADASGNGNDLSVYPGYESPGYSAAGRQGGAAVFNSDGGTAQGWVTGQNVLAPSFTFAAWVKPMGTSSMLIQPWSFTAGGYEVYFGSTYRFATIIRSSIANYMVSGTAPSIGSWQHIALTYSPSSGPDADGVYTGTLTSYVDGQVDKVLSGVRYAAPASNFMALGRRSSAFFNGLMDEIYLCEGVLSDAEIQGLAALIPPVFEQSFSIATDRTSAVYKLGVSAEFIVTVPKDGTLLYVLTRDGEDIIEQGTVSCNAGTNIIDGALSVPGFLRCVVTYTPTAGGDSETLTAAAAFNPESIVPASDHMPADFDSFWQGKKQELTAIPMDFSMEAISSLDPAVSVYDIEVPCVGPPVRGYYGVPDGAEVGKCPAIVFFQGAGVTSATQSRILDYCKKGFIALEINAHGILNGQPADYYLNLKNGELAGYPYFGREDPDDCYFTGMFLRVFRALQFMKAQPEWDGRNLVVYGSSQGGAQAIAGAGLDPDVTYLVAGVPGTCDHGGEISGWPRLIPDESDAGYSQILNTSRYVDAVNFGVRANASALVTVGFIDNTCRPTSIYAMYNSYGGCSKEILDMPMMAHAYLVEHAVLASQMVLENLIPPSAGGLCVQILTSKNEP